MDNTTSVAIRLPEDNGTYVSPFVESVSHHLELFSSDESPKLPPNHDPDPPNRVVFPVVPITEGDSELPRLQRRFRVGSKSRPAAISLTQLAGKAQQLTFRFGRQRQQDHTISPFTTPSLSPRSPLGWKAEGDEAFVGSYFSTPQDKAEVRERTSSVNTVVVSVYTPSPFDDFNSC